MAVVIEIGGQEIVRNVQVFVDHIRFPRTSDRILGNLISQDANRRFGKQRTLRVATKQRYDDQFRAAVGIEVGKANAVDGRLDTDAMQLPGSSVLNRTLQPLQ